MVRKEQHTEFLSPPIDSGGSNGYAMGVVIAPVSGYQDDLEWLTNVCYLAKHFAVHTITTGLFDRNVFTRLFKRVQLGAFETDTLALVRCWRGLHFFAVRP